MKIFVSWSGATSRQAAELVRQWLPNVIQEAHVWVSFQDIGKGEKWTTSLWDSLAEIQFGLLMVTRANATAPWIMFEAGALSKTVQSRVIPILCDLDRLDVSNTPLSQFQNALVNRDEFWQVTEAINSVCDRPLDASRLQATFDKWWPDFLGEFGKIEFEPLSEKKEKKPESVRLDKIESALDGIIKTLRRLERHSLATELENPFLRDLRVLNIPEGHGKTRTLADLAGTGLRIPLPEESAPQASAASPTGEPSRRLILSPCLASA